MCSKFSAVSTPVTPTSSLTKQYGLFLLNENESPGDLNGQYGVDVVAIHGLNGDAFKTWEHENGTLWIRDILPEVLPGSRIYTYSYQSELFRSSSKATLKQYSRNLLEALENVAEEKRRPMIFVCHSLGGIVFKQVRTPMPCVNGSDLFEALVLAHEDNHIYADLLSAISAVLFFGTPHRGSRGANIGQIVGKVFNMCGLASPMVVRDDLLCTLGFGSQALNDLAESSRNRMEKLEIVTFCETQRIRGAFELVRNCPPCADSSST